MDIPIFKIHFHSWPNPINTSDIGYDYVLVNFLVLMGHKERKSTLWAPQLIGLGRRQGRADMSPRKPGGKRRSQQKPQFFHGMLMWKWIFHDISSSVQKVRLDSCHVFQANLHCCKVNLSFPSQMSVFSTRSIAEFLGKFLVFRVCSLGLNSSCRAAKSYLRLQLLMAEYLHIRSISKFVYRG